MTHIIIGTSGISWRWPRRRAAISLAALLAMVLAVLPSPANADEGPTQAVVVRMVDGATDGAGLIEDLGGTVTAELGVINGFAVDVPTDRLPALEGHPQVAAVTPDGEITLTGWDSIADGDSISITAIADKVIDADRFWNEGFTGAGVDVAIIDSGVSAGFGLADTGKVVNGPDLSFESQNAALIHEDSFGHGTHLAGIIAARDPNAPAKITTKETRNYYFGVAPDARIVSVKVADRNGAADVSQVIAAIDWVVQHRTDNDLNIRVLNLSFGTDGTQSYVLDPLAFAVEQAWHNGIVVVVASGNDGNNAALRNPAYDPFVIAVGAADGKGTLNTKDDRAATFSNCGTEARSVDLVAPGSSVVASLSPNSAAAANNPDAILDGRYITGSGTSQAAAVVSGAAALIIDQRPAITPDQVKALLASTGRSMRGSKLCQGGGVVDLGAAVDAPTPTASQQFARSTGTGTLEGARGSYHIEHDGVVLEGEQDIMGSAFDGASWSSLAAAGMSWSGGTWNGASWSGASWSGMSWSGMSWSGASWSGMSWSGDVWLGLSWNGPANML